MTGGVTDHSRGRMTQRSFRELPPLCWLLRIEELKFDGGGWEVGGEGGMETVDLCLNGHIWQGQGLSYPSTRGIVIGKTWESY